MHGVFGCIGKLAYASHTYVLLAAGSPKISYLQSELGSRLSKEKPRNHLDMRHRLDSEGKRYGKTIDYK